MPAPLVPWPRAAAAVAIGCAVVMVGFGAFVAGDNHGLGIDDAFNRWTHRRFSLYTLYDLVQLADPPVVFVAVSVLVLGALVLRRFDFALLAAIAPPVAIGLTEWLLKPLFDRTVPIVEQNTGVESTAYPSGHATAVCSVLVLLALLLLRIRLPTVVKVAGLAVLVAYYAVTVIGLVGQYYHYLTDTIGALLVAGAVVLGGGLGIDGLRQHRRARGE